MNSKVLIILVICIVGIVTAHRNGRGDSSDRSDSNSYERSQGKRGPAPVNEKGQRILVPRPGSAPRQRPIPIVPLASDPTK